MSKSNPVARLNKILKEAKRSGGNKPIKEVWAKIAGLESTDHPKILRFVADLIILSEEAKKAVEDLDNVDHKIYLMPFKNIDRALTSINLDGIWESFGRHLDDPTMVALDFCADTLSRTTNEKEISHEELEKLRAEIEDILNKVISLDIPEDLKVFLVEHLEQMRGSILNYQILGNEGLRKTLESLLGASILNQDMLKREMNNEKNKSVLIRFWKAVENLANSLTVVESIKALGAPIVALLTSGN